jgi:hypothetical protein
LKLSPASPKAFSASPADLFELVKAGANADAIEKLWQVQKEWKAAEAKDRFDAAFATFKKNAPEILKTKRVSSPHQAAARLNTLTPNSTRYRTS